MKHIGFKNEGYKAEWKPGYADGSCYQNEDGSWTVYDGGQNFMGMVKTDGGFVFNGSPSEYKESFLAAEKKGTK